MAKTTKFIRSQRAHERLVEYHEKNEKNKRSRSLRNYHVNVFNEQQIQGVILSKKKRKELYNFWIHK